MSAMFVEVCSRKLVIIETVVVEIPSDTIVFRTGVCPSVKGREKLDIVAIRSACRATVLEAQCTLLGPLFVHNACIVYLVRISFADPR